MMFCFFVAECDIIPRNREEFCMSGHNKWSKIKNKKGEADAKRGAIFNKLSREIL